MVITTRIPAPAVSGRVSPRSVLAHIVSSLRQPRRVTGRAERERHHRIRRERLERERRTLRSEMAMVCLGVRR
ncbi:hypothetical protein GCM10009722_10280 [Williamsia deligens]|nr:hypothetical protein [Williamsia deligens]